MRRVGWLGLFAACAAFVAAASAPAFAGTQNLSGTVTTTVPSNFTDDSSTNAANATGASNGTYLTLTHSSSNNSGTWTVSAGLSGWTTNNNGLQFNFYNNGNMGTMQVTRIQFVDSSGNTATLSSLTINLSNSTTTGTTTFNTNLNSFSIVNNSGTFSTSNVNAINIDFGVSANGNKTLGLDAVDVIDSVPEPSTFALFSLGLAALGGGMWRRRKRRAATRRAAA
jgi:hypothetical protein